MAMYQGKAYLAIIGIISLFDTVVVSRILRFLFGRGFIRIVAGGELLLASDGWSVGSNELVRR